MAPHPARRRVHRLAALGQGIPETGGRLHCRAMAGTMFLAAMEPMEDMEDMEDMAVMQDMEDMAR